MGDLSAKVGEVFSQKKDQKRFNLWGLLHNRMVQYHDQIMSNFFKDFKEKVVYFLLFKNNIYYSITITYELLLLFNILYFGKTQHNTTTKNEILKL